MKYALFILALLILPALALAQDTSFVPLTNIPFIAEAGNALNLETFLNGLYRMCIGIAAVVAVLQIMRAGIIYMGGDSVTEKKEEKNLIALSIGGLILVLSPVIVFSIINPSILSLKINNLEELRVRERQFNTVLITAESEEACVEQGGVVEGEPDSRSHVQCRVPRTNSDGTGETQQCENYTNFTAVSPPETSCRAIDGGEAGYTAIDNPSCCSGMTEGGLCCGLYRDTTQRDDLDVSAPMDFIGYARLVLVDERWRADGYLGAVPNDLPYVNAYHRSCLARDGQPVYEDDDGWFEDLATMGEDDFQCAESTGVPPRTETTKYKCRDRQVSCTLP